MSTKLLRLMTLVRHIPYRPYKRSPSELQMKLEEEGIYVSIRTIQRDLDEMSGMRLFNLTSDDRSKPHGWYFEHHGGNDMTGMIPLSLAVALQTWSAQASHLLPASILNELHPFLDKAKQVVHGSQSVSAIRWFKSLHQHSSPSFVDHLVPHSTLIHEALWRGCTLNAEVQRVVKGHMVWLRYEQINPLGVLSALDRPHLLCTLSGLDPKVYSITFDHIRHIALTNTCATKPKAFTIDKWLSERSNKGLG